LKRALLLLAFAGCANQDVVARGGGDDDGGPDVPLYCQGDGPPVLVGDGITVGEGDGSSDDVCSGEVAVRTFRHALCTCEDYVTSVGLTTDSFDSAVAPYAPGQTAGPVGIDGIMQTNDVLSIGGDLIVSGAGGASFGADIDIAGTASIGGNLGRVPADVTIDGDANVNGNIDLTSLTVGGTLTYPATATATGTVNATSTVRAPVTVEPPCACEPGDLVDIQDFIASHRTDNEDALIGLTPDRLTGYSGAVDLDLPCGRYYLGPIGGDGALTIRAMGRVAILVDGDVRMTQPLNLVLGTDDAEIDLMIGGILSSVSSVTAGDPEHPARTRIYVGGVGTVELSGELQFAANLYAPSADFSVSGNATLFGSLFVKRLAQSAPMIIHYDVDVLRADAGC
jgi:hypothetical protein